jgi:hypothetical protein
MGVAFEMTRAALRVDGIDDRVASKIIDLAKAGECDPNEVCERALAALRRGTAADRLGDQTVHLGLPSFPSET